MYTAIALTRYGSLEIKRAYRKNMTTGIMAAAVIMISGVAAYHCLADKSITDAVTLPPIALDTVILGPNPPIYEDLKPARSSAIDKPIPKIGIPTPVPDDQADNSNSVPTDDELWVMMINKIPSNIESLGTGNIVIANPDDILPPPDTFIPVDELPQTIESVAPIFPEMARIAGVQGDVWVRVFVDKNGNVRDVIIAKSSGANAGFEESAIAAARQTTWTPAISNGQPVGVWVSYKIEFRLK